MDYNILSIIVFIAAISIIAILVFKDRSEPCNSTYAKIVSLFINHLKVKGDFIMNTFEMQPSQFFEADVVFLNKKGNPANVDSGSVKFFLSELNADTPSENPIAVITNDGEAGEKHLKVQTPADEVTETAVQELWVEADADLDNDQDDSTSEDVAPVKIKLATIVRKPLQAVGAGIQNASAVQDVAE